MPRQRRKPKLKSNRKPRKLRPKPRACDRPQVQRHPNRPPHPPDCHRLLQSRLCQRPQQRLLLLPRRPPQRLHHLLPPYVRRRRRSPRLPRLLLPEARPQFCAPLPRLMQGHHNPLVRVPQRPAPPRLRFDRALLRVQCPPAIAGRYRGRPLEIVRVAPADRGPASRYGPYRPDPVPDPRRCVR